MPNIPYEFVVWTVENIVHGYGEFNNPQIGGKMATVLGNPLYDNPPQFFGQRLQFHER